MQTKFVEASQADEPCANWGKFLLLRFDKTEWNYRSNLPTTMPMLGGLLRQIGWDPTQIIVFDLQTCEGAAFRPGGSPASDLNKHAIWVCPLFQPFLEWLYVQDVTDLAKLPAHVALPNAPFAFRGHRHPGPNVDITRAH